MSTAATDSVIHDIGYQRYAGPRLGRPAAVRAMYAHSLRTAFGLGRGAKAKIFPWSVAALALGVAAIGAAIRAQGGPAVIDYLRFPEQVQVLTLLFLAVVAPELLSRDLRAGVLPLYFSRPLHRGDYALVKYAALASAVWLLLAGPELLMFAAGAFGSGADVWHELGLFWPGLVYAAMHALVMAAVAALIAALTGRRAVAAGAIAAAFLVPLQLTGILWGVGTPTEKHLSALAGPMTLLAGVRRWVFDSVESAPVIGPYGPLYAVVGLLLPVACVILLLVRYRRVQA